MTHHTKDKGDLATIKAMTDLTIKGYTILAPVVSEHLPFDFIAYKDGRSLRIQAKYSSNGKIKNQMSWADKNGNHIRIYNNNDFDYYAIYLQSIDTIIYPSIEFGGHKITYIVPHSATPFYWYEDFLNFTDKIEKRTYKDFGIDLTTATTQKTIEANIKKRKVKRPTKEELEKLLWEQPTSQLSKQFGVSDKAIEKWAKLYNIPKPPRGYWAKLKSNKK